MKDLKKMLLIILMLAGTGSKMSAQQRQISLEEAQKAAIARVASQKTLPKSDISVTAVSSCENTKGEVLMYEIETDKGITVLLSGNRSCLPILGVHGNEDGLLLNKIDSLPCGLQFLINWYKKEVDDSYGDTFFESIHLHEWQSLINGDLQTGIRTGCVPPLLSSMWSQKRPNSNIDVDAYNYLMPPGGDCSHCLAGCVAVAMGQVMYYWKYPVLIESRETQFDWCNMSDKLYLSDQNYTKSRNAISYLLLECGKSVDMDYGCTGSGAETEDVRDALVERFNYSNSADYKRRIWYSDNEWKQMLMSNLGRGKPVIYRGHTALVGGSGHAFVCDGFNEIDEFHFNWGWGDEYSGPNSYYTIDNPNPNGHNYQYLQGAVFDIQPAEEQIYCDITLCLDDFYGAHTSHGHPTYTSTPQTMTTLISASTSNLLSWRTIPSGASAEYVAHKEVVLQPGFTAEHGSDFTARIEKCEPCENRMMQVEIVINDDTSGVTDSIAVMRRFYRGDTTIIMTQSPLTLFPNPAEHTLTLVGLDAYSDMDIFDINGRAVNNWSVTSSCDTKVTIDIGQLIPAAYIVRIVTSDGKINLSRFLKK